jgi:hypothetical protein
MQRVSTAFNWYTQPIAASEILKSAVLRHPGREELKYQCLIGQ